MKNRTLAILFAALTLAGCSTAPPIATASGKPETTITAASPDATKSALVAAMLNAGYRITKDTAYELSFDKAVDNVAMSLLLGSKYDVQPNYRVSFSILQEDVSHVRVVGDVAVITNPGSSFERRTDLNESRAAVSEVQSILDQTKKKVETPPAAQPPKRVSRN